MSLPLRPPPEFADGGYWYVIQSDSVDTETTFLRAFAAWRGVVDSIEYAAIRTPDPVDGIDAVDVLAARVIEAAVREGTLLMQRKPFARNGGR